LGLLLARGGPVHREELWEVFWPDLAANRAGAALRTTLHDMRRALQPELDGGSASGVVIADGETILLSLSEHDHWDGAELERAALDLTPATDRIDELEAAERLYRGPFLPEWPYEDWCAEPRRRLEEAYSRVQECLALSLMSAGRHDGAALRWRRLVASEPERESWHRELMRCYAATAERALALRQFHACRTALRRGQGVEPGPETQDLYMALLRDEDPPRRSVTFP
jgi:DNA-binding SARP family transcriptional activator